MVKFSVERKSRMIIGAMALILIGIFISFTLANETGVLWGMIITGILLSLLLYSEGSIIAWIKGGKYKSIGFGDLVVIGTFVVATLVLLNSLFLIPMIGEAIPLGILSFVKGVAITVSILAGILVLIHIITPRFD